MANIAVQCRLAWYARWLLIISACLVKYLGIRIPFAWVKAVTNRSWRMRLNGRWYPIRIDDAGRMIQ